MKTQGVLSKGLDANLTFGTNPCPVGLIIQAIPVGFKVQEKHIQENVLGKSAFEKNILRKTHSAIQKVQPNVVPLFC